MTKMRKTVGNLDGQAVEEVLLTSPAGVEISILSYAALIRDWRVPVKSGKRSVVLGFDSFDYYRKHSPYFGAVAGRVANRIAGARFDLDGETYHLIANEGRNHLHGGPGGLGKRNWSIADYDGQSVRLEISSDDGDMGYPGRLQVLLTYRLTGYRLELDFQARSDRATPVNLIQHNYFNLMGQGDILDHRLQLAASAFLPVDGEQIPTGAILPVDETMFDFRSPRSFRDHEGQPVRYDHNLVLDSRRSDEEPVATLFAPDNSLTLHLYSDQPGIQLYNGWKLAVPVPGLSGEAYGPFSGVCLEDQLFPNALNHPYFPSTVIGPNAPYKHKCAIEIA